MSTTTMPFPPKQATVATHATPAANQPLRLGTFADGQRAVGVTVSYSPRVGSFADAARD